MGLFSTGGSFPAGLTPSPTKTLFSGNYLTFDSGSGGGTFAQQFLYGFGRVFQIQKIENCENS